MLILDLHSLTVNEAIRTFVKFYNENFKKNETIEVIHGYGKSGSGGKIKKRIRQFFNENTNYFEFKTGEEISANLGMTLVYMNKRIPKINDMLASDILEFCSTPKTIVKISGHLRNYTQNEIIKTLKSLEKTNSIIIIFKGKYKCYQKK